MDFLVRSTKAILVLIIITVISVSGVERKTACVTETPLDDLYGSSCNLARSSFENDMLRLESRLSNRVFLHSLDSEEAYSGPVVRLHVAGILQILSENDCDSARGLLLKLTHSQVFLEHRARVELLIRSLIPIRPSPKEVIEFWDKHFLPEDGYSSITASALLENGSEPAISLFEIKIKDSRFPKTEREFWLTGLVLQYRNDINLLQACDRLMDSDLEDDYQSLLLEVLFDYRPNKWYGAGYRYKPPPREEAEIQALKMLQILGEKILGDPSLENSKRRRLKSEIVKIKQLIEEKTP